MIGFIAEIFFYFQGADQKAEAKKAKKDSAFCRCTNNYMREIRF